MTPDKIKAKIALIAVKINTIRTLVDIGKYSKAGIINQLNGLEKEVNELKKEFEEL